MNIVKTSAFVSHILKENMLCTSFSKVDLVTEVTFFKIFFFFLFLTTLYVESLGTSQNYFFRLYFVHEHGN